MRNYKKQKGGKMITIPMYTFITIVVLFFVVMFIMIYFIGRCIDLEEKNNGTEK